MKTLKNFLLESIFTENVTGINGFCILKPGFTDHDNDLCNMLKNNNWGIVQKTKMKLSHNLASKLYQCHKDKDFYKDLCNYMSSDDCVCYSCYKDCNDPIADMKSIKDKVRKAWGIDDMKNAMHSSDSLENVNRESKLIFEKYETA